MSEQAETVADIIAEMRTKSECAKQYDDGLVMMLTDFADRIEAAHKREVEKLNSVIQAQRSAFDAEIDRLRREAEELRKQVGNAAKMYEALVKIRDSISGDEDVNSVELANIAYTAIAAPPRNCEEYAKPKLCKSCAHYMTDGCEICGCTDYKDREGDSDGSK